MQLTVNNNDTFIATGGKKFDAALPTVVFLHGAGNDHTAWAQHDRWFAHHGYNVLAPDLPGHGRSAGKLIPSIAEMADWTSALLDASGATQAKLIGHSMGSLIALEMAARHPAKVSALVLVGTSAAMAVGPDLLKAAEANDHAAIDMVSIWGLGHAINCELTYAKGAVQQTNYNHHEAMRIYQCPVIEVRGLDQGVVKARVADALVVLIVRERRQRDELRSLQAGLLPDALSQD